MRLLFSQVVLLLGEHGHGHGNARRSTEPRPPDGELVDRVVGVALRGCTGSVIGAEPVVDTLRLDVLGEDLEADGAVDPPVEAAAARVGAVLEASERQLGRADALRAESIPIALVVEVGLLCHLRALDVVPASRHVVVAPDVVAAAGFLFQQCRRGRELQPGGRGQLDDLGGALRSMVGEHLCCGHRDPPSDVTRFALPHNAQHSGVAYQRDNRRSTLAICRAGRPGTPPGSGVADDRVRPVRRLQTGDLVLAQRHLHRRDRVVDVARLGRPDDRCGHRGPAEQPRQRDLRGR